LAAVNTGILTLSALKGVFSGSTEEPVSYVNAPQLAEQRGLEVREISTATSRDYKSLITLRSKSHSVAGTLSSAGHRSEPRIVMVDDHVVEVAPSPHMLVVRNDDRPGMIGIVGTALGLADISISSMAVGPSPRAATAMMVISTIESTPDAVVDQLRGDEGILDIHRVSL
jgi:D-3-phosphoglycerate dehydrogenase